MCILYQHFHNEDQSKLCIFQFLIEFHCFMITINELTLRTTNIISYISAWSVMNWNSGPCNIFDVLTLIFGYNLFSTDSPYNIMRSILKVIKFEHISK